MGEAQPAGQGQVLRAEVQGTGIDGSGRHGQAVAGGAAAEVRIRRAEADLGRFARGGRRGEQIGTRTRLGDARARAAERSPGEDSAVVLRHRRRA